MTDQPNNEETSTPTPYKGQYRKDVYEDDPKNADEIEDPVQTATPKNLMGSEKEVNYKKRYDDLKRHYDHKLNEWRTKEQTLMAEKKLGNTKLPKTPEELDDKIIEMLNTDRPVIFDCLVDKQENCFPMIPSGKPHNQMLLGPKDQEQNKITGKGKTLV